MESAVAWMAEIIQAVSEQDVELLRRMYGRATISEFAESLHPQAELHQAKAVPDADDYFGREEFVRGTLRWHEEWEAFSYHPQEFIDSGKHVLVRVRLSGRARSSGIALDMTLFHVWTFRDNLPWRCEVIMDEGEAFEATGMRQ